MGYDSRLYIVRKTDVPMFDGIRNYAETMAVYEMRVFPLFQKLFEEAKITQLCPCEGDNYILKDMYGEPLHEATLEEVIDCLNQVIVLGGDDSVYARVRPLLALLQEYQKIQNNYYRLAVLHYGH